MRSIFAALWISLALTAQATPCHASLNNLTFDNGTSMGGPGLLLAMRTTAPSSHTATRVEVFTGEQQGVNTIALWSHDAANNQPLAPLATGSWSMSRVNTWQGANLTPPVPITAGQILWVVWSPINGSQSSVQAAGVALTYRGSTNGGTSWNGPFTGPWKFRIWCGPLGEFDSFGLGCRGTGNLRPEMAWFGLPQIGTTLNIHLERGRGSSAALLAVGDSDTSYQGNLLPFSMTTLGAPGCVVLCSVVVTLFTPTDVTGQAVIPVSVPANPVLVGLRFFDQWFVLDPANALGMTSSSGGRGTVGS